MALTGGEASDFKGYMPVMEADGPSPKVLLADKGYDADFIREDMEKRGGTAMIPTKRNRLIQLPVDAAIYAGVPVPLSQKVALGNITLYQ